MRTRTKFPRGVMGPRIFRSSSVYCFLIWGSSTADMKRGEALMAEVDVVVNPDAVPNSAAEKSSAYRDDGAIINLISESLASGRQ